MVIMTHYFNKTQNLDLIKAIATAEKMTSGEIRVHIQSNCKEDVFNEAKKVFHRLKMYKTKERNGILIFIALKSKRFAILGDKGIHEKVRDNFWNETRDIMLEEFKKDKVKEGIIQAVHNIGEKLKKYFPIKTNDRNELPNTISEK